MSLSTIYIHPVTYNTNPPPLKKKLQQRLLQIEHNKKVINNYKIIKKLQKLHRTQFYKIWINVKLSKSETITIYEKKKWRDLCIRLEEASYNEYISQLNETRKWLKLRESGCARRLNFYPGARKLKF